MIKKFIYNLLIKLRLKKDTKALNSIKTYAQADLEFMQNCILFQKIASRVYQDAEMINKTFPHLSFDRPPRYDNETESFQGVYLINEKK